LAQQRFHDVRHPELISDHMGAANGNDSRIGTERHMNVEQGRIWRLIFSREWQSDGLNQLSTELRGGSRVTPFSGGVALGKDAFLSTD
jgi:hypothetical protein